MNEPFDEPRKHGWLTRLYRHRWVRVSMLVLAIPTALALVLALVLWQRFGSDRAVEYDGRSKSTSSTGRPAASASRAFRTGSSRRCRVCAHTICPAATRRSASFSKRARTCRSACRCATIRASTAPSSTAPCATPARCATRPEVEAAASCSACRRIPSICSAFRSSSSIAPATRNSRPSTSWPRSIG